MNKPNQMTSREEQKTEKAYQIQQTLNNLSELWKVIVSQEQKVNLCVGYINLKAKYGISNEELYIPELEEFYTENTGEVDKELEEWKNKPQNNPASTLGSSSTMRATRNNI
jgi:hypothetical protein